MDKGRERNRASFPFSRDSRSAVPHGFGDNECNLLRRSLRNPTESCTYPLVMETLRECSQAVQPSSSPRTFHGFLDTQHAIRGLSLRLHEIPPVSYPVLRDVPIVCRSAHK